MSERERALPRDATMTAAVVVNDVQGAKLRKVWRELHELDVEVAEAVADHPIITAAFEQLGRRLYQCPICFITVELPHHRRPLGWVIVEPFTRVAACVSCAPKIRGAW